MNHTLTIPPHFYRAYQDFPKPVQILHQKKFKQLEWHPLLTGALALSTGLLLKQRPATLQSKAYWLPTDWKLYAKAALGIVGVQNITQAFQVSPPVGVNAMASVAAIHLLTQGVSKTSGLQALVLMPLVGAFVQGTHWIKQSIKRRPQSEIPSDWQPWIQGGLFAASLLIGLKALPKIYEPIIQSPWFKKIAPNTTGLTAMTAGLTCARGCTPGGVICLSETAELLGGLSQSHEGKSNLTNTSAHISPALSHTRPVNPTTSSTIRFGNTDDPDKDDDFLDFSDIGIPPLVPKNDLKWFTRWLHWSKAWQEKGQNPLKRLIGFVSQWLAEFTLGLWEDLVDIFK